MNPDRPAIPWFGIALAAFGVALLDMAHLSPLVLVVVAPIWLASLGIDQLRMRANPVKLAAAPRIEPETIARTAMEATIESVAAPLVLMEGEKVLAANEPARAALGAHIVGQDARMALRLPEALQLLDMPDESSLAVRGLTGNGSLWQMSRRTIDERHWMIALIDRTSEADISRAHTDFVANASHELRTPLASIIAYVETLEEDDGHMEAPTRKRFLGTVLREARRMHGLLADLMSLSQLEAEKHDLPVEPIDMAQLAARVVAEFAPPPGQDEARVRLDCQAAATVTGDTKQLEQLLRNLIDNALKYGDPGTPVEVSLAGGPRATVEMKVRDHGPGIAADHLPHLTRRFYRTDPGRSRAAGGTGLGLAICKHIVERHKGRLDITSTLGEGTQVAVRLPLARSAAA